MNFVPTTTNTLIHHHHHAKIMEWTNDDALELIEQYRHHTELWNRADPKYKDKLCRFRAWSEIAERFGCSKAEVERKMNVLLTQYRREKHKMLVKLYQGIQPNPSKWYAFKRFDFMEAGGGSGSLTGIASNGNMVGGGTLSNGHTVVTAAGLNGLSGFVDTTATSAAASTTLQSSSSHHHRRLKSKEMKYFGAMGLNLPLLIANSQTLDTWNAVGPYSPPIGGDRGQLHVPLSMPFSGSASSELSVNNAATRSLFSGSNNSDMSASPQKPMETGEIDDKDVSKCERATPQSSRMHEEGIGESISGVSVKSGSVGGGGAGDVEDRGGGGGGGGGDIGNWDKSPQDVEKKSTHGDTESSSPIPNQNLHEAHKNPHHHMLHQRHHHVAHHHSRDQEDLDIKQELVDYFHAPHPPAPPGSHRSYSSTEENRIGAGGGDSDDFAQDLRVSAAAAAKSLDFSQFVLPRNLRRSSESIDEKFMPLNMRKMNPASSTATTAGQMLMNSLLSNESMSEDTAASVRGGNGGKSGSQDASTSAAAAAAAAFYAESLNKDDCDFIGSNVTLKLRSMDRTQRIIAEKLISEVLYYGQFNELERSAHIQPK